MIVPTSMTMPSQPMMPNTITIGNTDGMSRIKPADRSQNTNVMTLAIVSRSVTKFQASPLSISRWAL